MKTVISMLATAIVVFASAFCYLNKDTVFSNDSDSATVISNVGQPKANTRPNITIVAHSSDRLVQNFSYLVEQSGKNFLHQLRREVDPFLKAIDSTKPVGLMAFFGDEVNNIFNGSFDNSKTADMLLLGLPVSDIEQFKAVLSENGTVNECLLGYVYKPSPEQKYLIKHAGDYVYVSQNRDLFEQLPGNTGAFFNSIAEDHSIAMQLDLRTIPEKAKLKLSREIKESFNEKALMGIKNSQWMAKGAESLSNYVLDTEQLLVTLDIQDSKGKFVIGSKLTAKDDSEVAKESKADIEIGPSMFSGFHQSQDTGVTFGLLSGSLNDNFLALYNDTQNFSKQQAGNNGTPNAMESQLQLKSIFERTMESGRTDIAANYYADRNQENLVAAVYVAETEYFRNAIVEAHEKALSENKTPEFELNFAQHRGMKFHKGNIDLRELDLGSVMPLSKSLYDEVVFGMGDQAIYVAMGKGGFERLKKCINDSANPPEANAPKALLQFSLAPCLRKFQQLTLAPIPRQFFSALKRDGDKIRFESTPLENGYQSKISIDVGLVINSIKALEAIGSQSRSKFGTMAGKLEAAQRSKDAKAASHKESPMSNPKFRKGFMEGLNEGISEGINKGINRGAATRSFTAHPDANGVRIPNPYIHK